MICALNNLFSDKPSTTMNHSIFSHVKLILGCLLLSTTLMAQHAVPAHGGVWVHDEAGILSAQAKSSLEYMLKAERDSTSNQIAVLIINSLEGEDIDGYANRVFKEWKLGDEKKDNGVLFLMAISERQMKIEVGFGLEGVLTDAMSSRINRNEIAPYFRQGDYDNGIKAGALAIMQTIKGEYKNDDPLPRRGKKRSPWTTVIILIVFMILAARRKGGGGGGGRGGYWSSGAGWILPMAGMGRSSGSWGGGDFGGGGMSGGGGSSDSW